MQVADAAFRRQILVQALVLFQYLLSFSPSERSKANALPMTNTSALPPSCVLSPTNVRPSLAPPSQSLILLAETGGLDQRTSYQDARRDASDGRRSPIPQHGRARPRSRTKLGQSPLPPSVVLPLTPALQINWKLKSCLPFEIPSLPPAASETASRKLLHQMRKIKPFPYKMGNPTVSKLWDRNLTSLEGFEPAATTCVLFSSSCGRSGLMNAQGGEL